MGKNYAPNPVFQFFGDDGKPLVFGELRTYVAGTDTPIATYDVDGKPNEARIRLNSRGETDTAIMLDAGMTYKFVLLRADGTEVWTRDNVRTVGTVVNPPTIIVAGTPDEIDVSDRVSDEDRLYEVSLSETVKDKIEANREASETLGKLLENETAERKDADAELKKLIDSKQTDLKDGDNIHIDDENKVNVVLRKTLFVKAPLTAESDKKRLVLGIDGSAYALAADLSKESEARAKGDSQLLARIDKVDGDLNAEILNRIQADAGKQEKYFMFNPDSSSRDDVVSAIAAGRNILSASGSNAHEWLGSVNGGYPSLYRVGEGFLTHWYWESGVWKREQFDVRKPEWARLPYPTTKQTPGTELFAMGKFAVHGYSDNAASLRLVVKPTDGKDHAIYANGGGFRCYAETGSTLSTEFTQGKPYLRLHVVDTGYWESSTSGRTDTDWTISEAEIYAFNDSNGGLLYRVITEQGGLTNG